MANMITCHGFNMALSKLILADYTFGETEVFIKDLTFKMLDSYK